MRIYHICRVARTTKANNRLPFLNLLRRKLVTSETWHIRPAESRRVFGAAKVASKSQLWSIAVVPTYARTVGNRVGNHSIQIFTQRVGYNILKRALSLRRIHPKPKIFLALQTQRYAGVWVDFGGIRLPRRSWRPGSYRVFQNGGRRVALTRQQRTTGCS